MKGILFVDLGGTVLDNPDIVDAMVSHLVCGPSDGLVQDLYRCIFIGLINSIRTGLAPFKSVVEIHQEALRQISKLGFKDISGQAKHIAVDTYGNRSELFPEVRAVLRDLRDAGVRMIVASDNDFEILNTERSIHGLDAYFGDYWISEAAKAYKPATGFIEGLREFLPKNTHKCYFVGDTAFDMQCARALGIKSVLVARQPSDEGSDLVINNLSGLRHIVLSAF